MTHTPLDSMDVDSTLFLAATHIHLQLAGPRGPMLTADHLQRRLGPFLYPSPPVVTTQQNPSLQLRADWGEWPRHGPELIPSLRIRSLKQTSSYRLDRTDLDAMFSQNRSQIRGACAPSLLPVEECLRVLLWNAWTEPTHQGGLMLHCACLVKDGKAYCFPAHSGTGKSTIARLTPGDQPLTDELALLTRTATGWSAWPSPFWNWDTETPQKIDPTRAYPLAGVYFLQQAPSTQCQPIDLGDAFLRLIEQTFAYQDLPVRSARAVELVGVLLEDLKARGASRIGILEMTKGADPFEAIAHIF